MSARPRASKLSGKKRLWTVIAFIVGGLIIGGALARLSPIFAILAAVGVGGLAIFTIVKGAAPGLRTRKSGFAALGVAALLVVGAATTGAGTSEPKDAPAASLRLLSDGADTGRTKTPSPTPSLSPSPAETTSATEEVESPIPFERTTVEDPERDEGSTAITVAGVAGTRVTTYQTTFVDGKQVAREVVGEVVTLEPTTEVTAIGTRVPPPPPAAPAVPVPLAQQGATCDSNYTGACVPIASDVDCEGGGGNGPAYVSGPVQVVGRDIYKLDRDGDGIACD